MKTIASLLCLSFVFVLATRADDPNELWYRGFLKNETAKEMIDDDRLLEGLNALDEAFSYYKRVALEHPEFNSELVWARLQRTAEKRILLQQAIQNSESVGVTELEKELKSLKKQLRALRERKKDLDEELRDLRGDLDLGAAPRIEAPELPSFHSRLDDEERGLFSTPGDISELFPEGSLTERESESGEGIILDREAPPTVPENWIPRNVDGKWTFLIPLIETAETRPFSRLVPVPAMSQGPLP
ncbi:MAG: hypothetical protein AAF733_06835 [Verrucomicrobiota bacterium]